MLIDARNVTKAFGAFKAVDDASVSVEEGDILGLIGPNGAGKSTCFNMINGQLTPDGGEILLAGLSIAGLPPRQIWRLGVGRSPPRCVSAADAARGRTPRTRRGVPARTVGSWPRPYAGTPVQGHPGAAAFRAPAAARAC